MAKAHITTRSGARVVIEGTPDEVAVLVEKLQGNEPSIKEKQEGESRQATAKTRAADAKPTPQNLIASLIDGGFFRKPKDLGSVKVALQEMGHFYPVTTLSPVMLRMVRKRELRRLRDNKRWMYTG